MRPLSSILVLAFTVGAAAQPTFRLADPALFLDDRRAMVTGAPLVQQPFGVLSITVPGNGTFTVSDRPFVGAQRAGLFDGRGLFFHAGQQNVRLVSRAQILSTQGPVTAYARFEPSRSQRRGGLAHLAVADALDGRGMRSSDPYPRPARAVMGPRSSSAAPPSYSGRARADRNQTAPRPAARYLRDARSQRLATQVDRFEADRQRLATERDRVAQSRTWTAPVTRVSAPTDRRLAALVQDRDRLASDRARLVVERDQLLAALSLAESERDRLAAGFADLRERAEDAEAQAARASRSRSDFDRVQNELVRLRAEQSELRAQIETRDRAIAALSAEVGDRSGRLPSVNAELADVRRQLAEAVDARDRALLDRDVAYGQRDAAFQERDQAVAEADQLRIALADARADQPSLGLDLSAERAALDRDRALLDADRQALAAERASLAAARRASTVDRDVLEDREQLLADLSAAQAERDALVAERAALIAERDRLAAELANRVTSDRAPSLTEPQAPGTTIRTEPGPEGALAFLPGFDFARLQNPDVVRRRLDEADYPRWATVGRIEGDVLVLFQTDPTGRVIRTAVPTPIGGGLDGLAEEIVREMRFVPPVVDGQATGLRSQVVVRFEL